MNKARDYRLTLGQMVTYQIKLPGEIDFGESDWVRGFALSIEHGGKVSPVTVLTGKLDQAALHGLLRRLYSLGLPLISVVWRGEK